MSRQKEKNGWNVVLAIIATISFIAALAIVCLSCKTTAIDRASSRIIRIAAKNPGSLAIPCNQMYPPRILMDSTNTIYLQGDEVPVPGPVRYVTADCPDGVQLQVPCPPNTKQVDTVYKDHYREHESTYAIEAIQQEADKTVAAANKDRDKYKTQATTSKTKLAIASKVALVEAAILALLLIWKIWGGKFTGAIGKVGGLFRKVV